MQTPLPASKYCVRKLVAASSCLSVDDGANVVLCLWHFLLHVRLLPAVLVLTEGAARVAGQARVRAY